MHTCLHALTVTRWAEAIPIPDSTAETTALAFLSGWVSRFGAPTTIITDRGVQCESHLWSELLHFLSTSRHCTTAFYPQANGMVECFHRQLKAAIKAQSHPYRWVDILPLVLLSIRASHKDDLDCSPVDLTLGEPLRLPSDFSCTQPDHFHHLSRPSTCTPTNSFLPQSSCTTSTFFTPLPHPNSPPQRRPFVRRDTPQLSPASLRWTLSCHLPRREIFHHHSQRKT